MEGDGNWRPLGGVPWLVSLTYPAHLGSIDLRLLALATDHPVIRRFG